VRAHSRTEVVGLILVAALAATSQAQAAREMRIVVDRGHATIAVTEPLAARATLDLPVRAAATRFRKRTAGQWADALFLSADDASARFERGAGKLGSALLSWSGSQEVTIEGVRGAVDEQIETTLTAQTLYDDGVYTLFVPLGPDPVRVAAVAAHAEDRVSVEPEGESVHGELTVKMKPGFNGFDTALASIQVGRGRDLVHVRIDAGRLASMPQRPAVVLVLDASRSMQPAFDAEIAAANAYLAALPNADVEVLTFDRHVHATFGHFLPLATARAQMSAFSLVPANGSAVDEALAFADRLLAASPATDKRIVLLTDLRTRVALDPSVIRPPRALLHLAVMADGRPTVVRNDEGPWAPVPRATGGLLWTAHAQPGPLATDVFDEWVRPKRLDRALLSGVEGQGDIGSITEGTRFDLLAVLGSASPRATLEGELWSKPFRTTFAATEAEGRVWAAIATASPVAGDLEDEETRKLAIYGHAVSPFTSFLVPGAPPTDAAMMSASGISLGAITTCCCCCGIGVAPPKMSDEPPSIDRAVDEARSVCSYAGPLDLTIETADVEIVDVRDVTADRKDAESCIRERLWSAWLTGALPRENTVWNVSRR
jgi:hypothetical protein